MCIKNTALLGAVNQLNIDYTKLTQKSKVSLDKVSEYFTCTQQIISNLPEELLNLKNYGLEIRWC